MYLTVYPKIMALLTWSYPLLHCYHRTFILFNIVLVDLQTNSLSIYIYYLNYVYLLWTMVIITTRLSSIFGILPYPFNKGFSLVINVNNISIPKSLNVGDRIPSSTIFIYYLSTISSTNVLLNFHNKHISLLKKVYSRQNFIYIMF